MSHSPAGLGAREQRGCHACWRVQLTLLTACLLVVPTNALSFRRELRLGLKAGGC